MINYFIIITIDQVIRGPEADLKPGQPLKTKVDLGCNFYAQAVVDDPSKVNEKASLTVSRYL